MNRRELIKNAALAVAATTSVGGSGGRCLSQTVEPAAPVASEPSGLIDTHVYLSRWPFRRLAGDEPRQLVGKLKKQGVASAWAGSFDALLHRDLAAVNARLAEECALPHDVHLLPFGAVNPTLPDWEDDLRRCHEVHHMPGIRLHPDFHGYALDDPRFAHLLDLATQRRLIVQIGLGMDDPRLQHPLAMVPPVNPEPLLEVLPQHPGARVVLLNFWRAFGGNRILQGRLGKVPQLSFDIATIEGVAKIEELLRTLPALRLLFGSYAPFYNFGSSRRKLHESVLTPAQLDLIARGLALELLKPA